MKYDDFTLRIEPRDDGRLKIQAVAPNGSEAGRIISLDPSWLVASPNPKQLAAIGAAMYAEVFKGGVGSLWTHCGENAVREGRGLRLKLKMDLTEDGMSRIFALPWEYLKAPSGFVLLSRQHSLIRHLNAQLPIKPHRLSTKFRILIMACSPIGFEELRVNEAAASMTKALRVKGIEVTFRRGGLETLSQALDEKPFHALHFIGHGGFLRGKGVLFFEKPDGAEEIEGKALGMLLQNHTSLRLVVINACSSARTADPNHEDPFAGVAASLVAVGLPAVVAMSAKIADDTAAYFSKTFYQSLAQCMSVDKAVSSARHQLFTRYPGRLDWGIPTLFLRAFDGRGSAGMLFKPPLIKASILPMTAAILLMIGIFFPKDTSIRVYIPETPEQTGSILLKTHQNMMLGTRDQLYEWLSKVGRAYPASRKINVLYGQPDLDLPQFSNAAMIHLRINEDPKAPVTLQVQRPGHQAQSQPVQSEALQFDQIPVYQLELFKAILKALDVELKEKEEVFQELSEPELLEAMRHNAQGLNSLNKGYRKDAKKEFRAALEVWKSSAAAHNNLGNLLEREGNLKQAIQHQEQAVTLQENVALYRFNLGRFLVLDGREKEADAQFEETLRLDPSFGSAYNEWAGIYLRGGQNQYAIEKLYEGSKKDPTNAVLVKNLGIILIEQNKLKEGKQRLKAAWNSEKLDLIAEAEILFWQAKAAKLEGNSDQVCFFLNQLDDLDPSHLAVPAPQVDQLRKQCGCTLNL